MITRLYRGNQLSVWDALKGIVFRIKRKIFAAIECVTYSIIKNKEKVSFSIVSCQRNAGDFAINCLDSVYGQVYQRERVTHIFIDDASDDGTHEKIMDWLERHPDHTVQYIRNRSRKGGTSNTVDGMKMAPEHAIVIELNGDDWLPDNHVLSFFSKVYSRDDIWMTYNSFRYHDGPPSVAATGFPQSVIRNNTFRDQREWQCSHLHTFRKRLFDHVEDDVFLDPETGSYWDCADDQSLYLSMLELAGSHSRHISRITCIYNFWESSHSFTDSQKSIATAERIRKLCKSQPLQHL